MDWTSPEVVSTESQTSETLDPEEVRRLHWDEGLSQYKIAEEFGVHQTTIRNIMCRNNIPRRSQREGIVVNKGRILTIGEVNKTHKFCSGCNKARPVIEFYPNASAYDGLSGYCKKCHLESSLATGGKRYYGLHKRPFPLDNRCEICSVELNPMYHNSHHFDNNNLNLTISVCAACDLLAEGLDEIERSLWLVDVYQRLKEKIEEVEKTYVYLGPFKPLDGIRKLYSSDGTLTYKWCSRCGRMLPVNEFHKRRSGLAALCKECLRSSHLCSGSKRFTGLHKRQRPDHCELCGGNPKKLDYHHWDDNNRSKGVWVCSNMSGNKCHHLAEAIDIIDSGSPLPNKYSELKQRIILEDGSNTRIANPEKRVTLLEAEKVLSES